MPNKSTFQKESPERRRCNRCHATGRVACEACGGRGEVVVGRDMHGRLQFSRCSACFGSKTMRCRSCGGVGFT